jgi:hypothetical protein
MNKTISLAAIAMVAVIMGMSAFAPAMADKPGNEPNEGKVLVCHIPPGNPANFHTISISEDDVQDHLDHGDFEGDCDDF